MCVPVPPGGFSGAQSKQGGRYTPGTTLPITTGEPSNAGATNSIFRGSGPALPNRPGAASPASAPGGIDYSRYAGVPAKGVYGVSQNGILPSGFSWDEWMKVNPGAPDPRTHTNTGDAITPNQMSQWSTGYVPPTTPAVATTPPPPAAPPPPPGANTDGTPNPNYGKSAVVSTPAPAANALTPPAAVTPAQATPLTPQAEGTIAALPPQNIFQRSQVGGYPVAAEYSPEASSVSTPQGNVTNALMRRYKRKDWNY